MTFLTPWGLLGLLAIPIILGLHFFRQQRRVRKVGGLHLWDFAQIATPTGRRFERLRATLPLLFQLLAALLLTLLLAGFDIPLKKSAQHYSIILDDSISMQARVRGSVAAKRAVDALTDWADSGDRFTLVLAGIRPVVVAGPAATREEFLNALSGWTPKSAVANLDQAINIASKFGNEKSRIVLVTDNPPAAEHLKNSVTVWGVGRSAPNNAIVFADRFSASDTTDRVVATVQTFGANSQAKISAFRNDTLLMSRDLNLETSKPVSVQLDLPAADVPLRLTLSPEDALEADNSVILQPSRIKPVNIFLPDGLTQREAFVRAADAVRAVLYAPTPGEADLVFAETPLDVPAVRRSYIFTGAQTTDSLRMAPGRDLVTANESPITRGVSMAGVVWPFDRNIQADTRTALRADISYTSIPLLYAESSTSSSREYRVNLSLERTNIFRHTAWPVLMMNIIEECREALPGLSRTNLRAGEEVRLNLEPDPAGAKTFSLWREGDVEPLQTWQDELPTALNELPVGSYSVKQGDQQDSPSMGAFRVNLFSQGESDLAPLAELEPDLRALSADDLRQTERNYLMFYLLLAVAIGCIYLGWIYHDAGH